MFTLLIVDDEYVIREGLMQDVDWASIGVKAVGAARNGSQAISLIRELQPDILLADICMTTMSGIEMAEKLRESENAIKIIFLTGHDDFQYTQKAIELKAFDYLLKPALIDDLLAAVARATEELKRERSLQSRIAALETNLAAGRWLAQEKFFEEASIHGTPLTPEWEDRARALGIPLADHRYGVAVLELDEPQDGSPERHGRLLAAKEIVEEFTTTLAFRLIMVRAPRLVVILCEPSAPEAESAFLETLETIRKAVKSLLSATCTIGTGRTTDSVQGVRERWAEAAKALNYKFTIGQDCVIPITDVSGNENAPMFYPKAEEKRLLEALGTFDHSAIRQAVSHFIDTLMKSNAAPVQIRAALAEMISVLTRQFLEWDVDLYDSFRDFWSDPLSLLDKYRSPAEIRKWMNDIVLQAAAELEESRKNNIRGIVAQVQQLIRESYADADLSLTTLAGKVYMSSAYLSKLYKKETGETYVEYLTRVRMDEAKKRLKNSNMKAAEIGMLVGYPNAQYFSFLFKKYTGMSPIDFRESDRMVF